MTGASRRGVGSRARRGAEGSVKLTCDADGTRIRPQSLTTAMTYQPASGYPLHRLRRLRRHPRLRDLVREHELTRDDLIYPLFVYHGTSLRREIPSMPGQYQLSLDRLGEAVAEVAELGIPAVLLFGIPEHKD